MAYNTEHITNLAQMKSAMQRISSEIGEVAGAAADAIEEATENLSTDASQQIHGLMSTDDKIKLDEIEEHANNYSHPVYTARTGKPTENQTPGFGGSFTISQVKSDTSGHVSGLTDRSVKVPDTEASQSAHGLMSADDKKKLDDIEAGANKYIHPTGVAAIVGLYKITTNAEGHVINVEAVTKADITALGIPASNTDTKVTEVGNHYAPVADTNSELSASASGATAAWNIDVVKGIKIQRDAKGHVTGIEVESGKIPDNPNTNTIPSAYCSTAAATAAKVASCTGYILTAKTYLHVIITTANTSKTALTLNVNSKGAKPIYINGAASSASNYTLPAGSYVVYYDGTAYHFRTDGVLPGKILAASSADTATKAASADTATKAASADTATRAVNADNAANAANADNASKVNGHTVESNVPAGAKFSDTVYTHPTSSGNKHIPAGGSANQILQWSAAGTASWANLPDLLKTVLGLYVDGDGYMCQAIATS